GGFCGIFQQNNLREMWPEIAGKVIAAHSKVVRVKDSMLLIAADNFTIKKEILNRADDILLTIEQCGGGTNIRDLQVFLKKPQ
ncbi:MAG: DUF721 domain-containing protein, partial [Deltaproteobacteria bacterium]|nr:DUF721 domain-containing protein [Deltaproteobacteria bacterium]